MSVEFAEALKFVIQKFKIFIDVAAIYRRDYNIPAAQEFFMTLKFWQDKKGMRDLFRLVASQYQLQHLLPEDSETQNKQPIPASPGCLKIQEIRQSYITPQKAKLDDKRQSSSRKKSDLLVKKESEPIFEEEDAQNKMQDESSSSSYQSDGKPYKRGPYKSYSLKEKIQAVQLFTSQQLSISEISKKLGIPCKNIKRWATQGVSRKRGGGRRRTNPDLEEEVYSWLIKQYSYGQTISIEEIQEYALSRSKDDNFKASRGWASKFLQRYNIKNNYKIM